jgi:hypothetical protein
MKPLLLVEARQVWRAALRAGVKVTAAQWQAWADARLIREQAPAPWLLALSLAHSSGSALEAVECDIGLEAACWLDPEALVIGFVIERYLNGEVSLEAMWAHLGEVADVAEFMDSGKWKRYAAEGSISEWLHVPEPVRCLMPVASFARENLSSLLSSSAAA